MLPVITIMTKKAQFLELLQRYQDGTLTPEEKRLLDAWYNIYGTESINELTAEQLALTEAELQNLLPVITPVKVRPLWPRIAVAVSVLIMLSAGTYFVVHQQKSVQQTAQHDIAPGHNQATLTLANGQKITLTQGMKGQLATQGATTIQVAGNHITYNNGAKETQISNNTLTTARGERSPYPLVLADGTKVWLNAASSITFPTAFPGKERIVKITGEVYFEVAHHASQPFKVESPGQVTEDVGTHFNIMSYADETSAKVTLTEGAVKVNNHLLKPGEQTINQNGTIRIAEVNVDFELAWKDGYFRFKDAPITDVMRELARWYNIEVIYDGPQTQERFNAKISRYKNISAVLRILERTKGVHFKVEGRRVTVLNKF
jgi:transmembrane sensor